MKLKADNISQVAMEMERMGRTFYDSLSLGSAPDIVGIDKAALADIISDEKEHLKKLRKVRKLLST